VLVWVPSGGVRICTIIAKNYLAQARVLALSYAEWNPGAACSVLLIDDPDGSVPDEDEPFELLRPNDLEIDRFDGMAAMFDVTELATAVKPQLLAHLLERAGEPVAYFDPDIRFFADIDEIARLTAQEGIVLTPHVAHESLPRDGLQPSELDLLASGTYNLGFIGLAPGPATERLIAWWSERLRFDCVIDHALGMFVDQRWFDLVGSVVPHFHVLRDPGTNVAYWNLHERRLRHEGSRYTVNGQPLRFFHFSGFDPRRPHILSKHQNRIRLPDEPVIAELFANYAEALYVHGFASTADEPWRYGQLADGTMLTPVLRGLYREGERAGAFRHSPFDAAGTEEFIAWSQEPARVGARHGLTRLCLEMYDQRPDLSGTYPDLEGTDGTKLLAWVHRWAADEFDLPPHLLPPGSERSLEQVGSTQPWGVNVAGYLRSELGVGEAARSVISALDAVGVPVMPIHGSWIPTSRQAHSFAHLDTSAAPFPINLICVNADQLPRFLDSAGADFGAGRYTIWMWWWEVSTIPDDWMEAFDLLDEIWVGTEHVADALRLVSGVPVIKVRIPVAMPPVVPYSRSDLGLPDGFLFLFVFDFHSVFERKNPLAVVEAFRNAFEPGSGASLVLKCINQGDDPDSFDRLRLATAGHPDIHIIGQYVSAERKNAMIASCDCYVSLHRSEGFGLTPAEAMYLGKPVIATRYSGNLDFMTDANSYLVDSTIRPVGQGNLPYPPDGEWAEPDIEQAARLMRDVFDHPEAASERGRVAAADLRRTHAPQRAGEIMATRLAKIGTLLRAQSERSDMPAKSVESLGYAETLMQRGPVLRGENQRSVRALAHRVALRLMRPATVHQHELTKAILAAIDETRRETQRYRTQSGMNIARLLAEIRRQDEFARSLRAEVQQLRLELPHVSESPSEFKLDAIAADIGSDASSQR
jgi:glycosyltransferase involved in cell wall biosynthesis